MAQTHQEYVDAIKKSAIATGKKLLIREVLKRLPFLFVPILGPITELILGKVVEILVQETEFALFFNYIDMRVDAQGRAFSDAATKNYQVQLNGTVEEKAAAEKELVEKFREFVILTN